MTDLNRKSIQGFGWAGLSQVVKLAVQVIGVFVLSKFLLPKDYGLVALASVILGAASIFREFGTIPFIIQREIVEPDLLDSIFWLNIFIGVSLSALIGLFTPLIALWFHEPDLVGVLWALLIIFPLASVGSVQQALLEKESFFKILAKIEISTSIIGLVAAIFVANIGWGVYSLILQNFITTFLSVVSLWVISDWRPSIRLSKNKILSIFKFSSNLVGFNMFNYLMRNADSFIIGRLLGTVDLGYYSMAYKLMLLPVQNISSVISRALLPVFSILQNDKNRLAKAYLRVMIVIVFFTAPITFGFLALCKPLVLIILGSKWESITDILFLLIPVGLLQTIMSPISGIYYVMKRTDIMFRWGFWTGILVVPTFIFGSYYGLKGVAISYAIYMSLIFLPGLKIPYKLIELNVNDLFYKIKTSILLSLIMAFFVFSIHKYLCKLYVENIFYLSLLVFYGVLIYAILNFIFQRKLLFELFSLFFSKITYEK
jgi:PST family polysaccharide transporter